MARLDLAFGLYKIFSEAGIFETFPCEICKRQDLFVTGKHSHICSECGKQATRGWYTIPYCEACYLHSEEIIPQSQ